MSSAQSVSPLVLAFVAGGRKCALVAAIEDVHPSRDTAYTSGLTTCFLGHTRDCRHSGELLITVRRAVYLTPVRPGLCAR
jgi:hypothetical protein